MPDRRAIVLLHLLFALLCFPLVSCTAARPVPAAEPSRPKLAVLLVFDQMRGDYLSRWQDLLVADGFRRLLHEGVWFQNCHYPYANTMTGPGHATLSTGCTPRTHGIIGNDWYDRAQRKSVNCVGTDRHTQVPLPLVKVKSNDSASPHRLLAPTFADAFKAQLGTGARVVALSLKDRSAILPGGKNADACYWTKNSDGQFVTSTYYRDRPHDWVADFNRGRLSDAWFGKKWDRLRPALDYERYSGVDDGKGEGKGEEQGRTFPHPFTGGPKKERTVYQAALGTSPFGNEVLLALAKKAIEVEKLGGREAPDFLSISFSSNDLVGHAWGPDSQEVLDITLRSDLLVKELLSFLDEKVGKGKYVVALSADHGICPLPEVSRERGLEARRIDAQALEKRLEAFLDEKYPARTPDKGQWLEASKSNMLWLNDKRIAARGAQPAEVATTLAHWLTTVPGIQAAFTRQEVLSTDNPNDALLTKVRSSFHPERSGDVMLVTKEYHLLTTYLTGTTHGTPHSYDTHVPLIVMGPGIEAQTRKDRVSPELLPVLLARAVGIEPPEQARAEVPAGVFAK